MGCQANLNIAMLTHTYLPKIGGREIHVFKLSEALVKRGHRITIITSDEGFLPPEKGVKVIRLSQIKLRISGYPVTNYYRVLPKLHAIIGKLDCDMIHLHDILHYTTDLSSPLAKLLDIPFVVTIHGFLPQTKLLKLLVKVYYRTLGHLHLQYARRIILPSKAICHDLSLTRFKEKIRFIPNGVDAREGVQRELESPVRLIAVGRMIPRKGFQHIVKAMSDIVSAVPDIELNLVGPDGGYRSTLEKMVEEFAIPSTIKILGEVSQKQLDDLFRSSHICIVPSIWDNAPVTLLEALSWGVPVIASNVGGIPEILKDGFNGILVPPNEPSELGQAIITIVKNKDLYHSISKNVQSSIQDLSWDRIAEKTEAVYKEALE